MKRVFILCLLLVGSLTISLQAKTAHKEPVKDETTISKEDVERAKVLNERLIEIKNMDKSALTRAERKELRSEVKMIKEELAQISGGVYLSIGAIIVILLLLILLL